MTTYRKEIIKSMKYLSAIGKVIFIGQEAKTFFGTMTDIPEDKIIQLPVMEDAQLGMAIGMSIKGYIPVTLYRMDFFIIAMNQLVNQLDKINEMSMGEYNPKVIMRVHVGYNHPVDIGPQHDGNYIEGIKKMVKNIDIYDLKDEKDILPSYIKAVQSDRSSILVEYRKLLNKKE